VRVLLDTCAIVWAVSDPAELSDAVRTQLTAPETEVFVSPISCAELACLVARGRIKLDRHWKLWFRHFVALNGWRPIAIDLDIVEEAYSLPDRFHPDPADRILVATARMHRLTLVSADGKILGYPHVDSLW